jgi:integrase
MARTDDGRWTVSVGPHGATVRAREHPRKGSNVYLFAWDPELGANRKESLKFKVRGADGKLIAEAVQAAKQAALDLSNRLIRGEVPTPEEEAEPDRTVGRVFDLFRREALHGLSDSHEAELRRGLEAWESFLGRSFDLAAAGTREWQGFARARAEGTIDGRGRRKGHPDYDGRKVSPRTVAKDLKVLREVCRFAERWRDGDRFILDADPTRGLALPSEPNPRRPVADDATLAKLLKVAGRVQVGHDAYKNTSKVRAPLREMLILAAYTGRRIGAIVALRWSDWDPDAATYGTLRWRADSDKLGREWKAPVHPKVREALEALRRERPGVGEAWIFPAPESKGHVRADVAGRWLRKAEDLAEDHEHVPGFGWHAFRRMWATKRKHLSSKDVAYAGGWKDTATLERVYQQPDPETTEAVVLGGRELTMGPGGGDGPEDRAVEGRP